MIVATIMFTIINSVPLIYARALYKYSARLEEEYLVRKIGNLYDNKNVRSNREEHHRVWLFPFTFFYRRTIFTILTIFLFDKPDM